jgi:NlpC/P60 family putative phage cell wall peptidase
MTEQERAERAAVVAAARGWVGTPYHHMADIRGRGVDCAMLLVRIFVDCGLVPPFDPRPYPPDWHLHRAEERYLAGITRHARPVERPETGDIALYRYGRCFSHAALALDWPLVVHAFIHEGCVLADAGKAPFAGRRAAYFSFWGTP